jgi:drug/metabolite transporter (DMT)-like permease
MIAPRRTTVHAAMALTMVLWGVSFVASKVILSEITPLTYMGVRFLLASLAFGGIVLVRGFPRFSRRYHLLVAATALAEPVAYFLFESYGLTMTSATTASLIIATIPLVVIVFAHIFLGEPISRGTSLAVVLSIVGVAALVIGADHGGDLQRSIRRELTGVLLIVGAVVSAATYITLARYIGRTSDSVGLTIVQTWWGGLVFGLIWVAQPSASRIVTLSPVGWVSLTFLVFGATIAAFLLYNWALRHETAGRAALYINGIPVVTAITAWIVLGERLTVVQLAGAVCVVVAVRLAMRERPA